MTSPLQRAQLIQKNISHINKLDLCAQSIIQLSKKKNVRYQYVLREAMDTMFFGFSEKDRELGHKNVDIMKIYSYVMNTIKEKIENKLQVKKIGMIVGMHIN